MEQPLQTKWGGSPKICQEQRLRQKVLGQTWASRQGTNERRPLGSALRAACRPKHNTKTETSPGGQNSLASPHDGDGGATPTAPSQLQGRRSSVTAVVRIAEALQRPKHSLWNLYGPHQTIFPNFPYFSEFI
eukprot:436659-Rhodomonas_salina.1